MTRKKRNLAPDAFDAGKQEYKAGLDAARSDNRFMRNRRGLGGTGDWQLQPYELWRVRETARHMCLNDSLPGQMTEHLCDHILGTGFRLEPQTGDDALDAELYARWSDWAGNKFQCDFKREKTFEMLVGIALESAIRDGEMFGVFTEDGAIQLIEAERCVSPSTGTLDRKFANGIRFDGRGVPDAFYFSKQTPSGPYVSGMEDVDTVPLYDTLGFQSAFHLYSEHRVSQHRGYSWWTPVMVECGMLDDLDFAMVVKAQSSAAIAGVVEKTAGTQAGTVKIGAETSTDHDGENETGAAIRSGTLLELPQGVTFKGFTPAIPNSEHMEHVKYQQKKIGAALHLPYVLMLLDASETNFSGWRGAIDSARVTYRRIQRNLIEQMTAPAYRWQVIRWLPELGRAGLETLRRGRLFRHKWTPPAWKYINPLEDGQADSLILANRLNSPRGLMDERGRDYDDVIEETIVDNAKAIRLAVQAAEVINKEHPDAEVDWREVLRWQLGTGVSLSVPVTPDKKPQTAEKGNA